MWKKIQDRARLTFLIFRHAAKSYAVHRVNRMSAAVAYRAMFAMAPLLLLATYVVGIAIGSSEAARAEILEVIDRVAGPTVLQAIETLLRDLTSTSSITGIVSVVLLLWTSSSLFLELQNDLNDIFSVPFEKTTGILETVRKRGLGFLWALGLGLILVAVLFLNSIWQFLSGLFPADLASVHEVVTLVTPLVSLLVLPLVIALFFQTLTQVKVRWRAVWWGAAFTAVAFLVTAYGASIYFRLSSGSAAGIAASLFVILLLAYTLSSIFLFGAEVTSAYQTYLLTGHPPGVTSYDGEEVFVESPPQPVAISTVVGFLAGLFVGWRRRP